MPVTCPLTPSSVTPGGHQSYVQVTVEETEDGKGRCQRPARELRPLSPRNWLGSGGTCTSVLLGKEELSVQGPRARLRLLSAAVTVSAQLPNTQWLLGVPEVTAEPRGLSGLSQVAGRRKKGEISGRFLNFGARRGQR